MDRYRWETISTFAGHPVVTAAVVANVEWMLEERIPERAAALGEHLGRRLRELESEHPCVAEVAGAGLLWAVELVRPDGSALRAGRPPRAARRGAGLLAVVLPRRASARSAASRLRPHRRTRSASGRR